MLTPKMPALMSGLGLGCIVVTFFGESTNGLHTEYCKHTFPKRHTAADVINDVLAGEQMASDHVGKTGCPVNVDQQTFVGPFGQYYTQPLIQKRAVSQGFTEDSGDDWEMWMGPGGHNHESYRWAD